MNHHFCVGDQVILATDYHQYRDAINGPLKPGDVGLMVSSNIHDGVIRAFVAVSGSSWYYDKRALRRVPDNSGPTSSSAGLAAVSLPAPNAALGNPTAASPGAGAMSLDAGPAVEQTLTAVRLTFLPQSFPFHHHHWTFVHIEYLKLVKPQY